MAISGKKKQRRKVWNEIYWPDSTQSHANNFKGTLFARRVGDAKAGRRAFSLLSQYQAVYEATGVEHPLLKGTGPYSVELKRRPKQVST